MTRWRSWWSFRVRVFEGPTSRGVILSRAARFVAGPIAIPFLSPRIKHDALDAITLFQREREREREKESDSSYDVGRIMHAAVRRIAASVA